MSSHGDQHDELIVVFGGLCHQNLCAFPHLAKYKLLVLEGPISNANDFIKNS